MSKRRRQKIELGQEFRLYAGQEMLCFSEVKSGGNYWRDLAQVCSELRIMFAKDFVRMTDLTDRLNGGNRHSNQESRKHLEEKDCKLHFFQTGIVLEEGGRSVRDRTGCWIFVKRLSQNQVYRDQCLDLFLTMLPM